MLKLFVLLVILLLIAINVGIDFIAMLAWILISVLLIYFVIKIILGVFYILTSGTLTEMEGHEPSEAPVAAFEEALKISSEKTTDVLVKSGEARFRFQQKDWRKNLSDAFNNFIKGFFKVFK